MQLVENWRSVLFKSWSVWIMLLITLISAAQTFLGGVTPDDLGISPRTYSGIILILAILGPIARIINQNLSAFIADESGAVRKRTVGLIAAVSIAASAAFVAPWEGLRTQAYRDIVGVWTVCYGETKGVQPGDRYSPAECEAMLSQELRSYAVALGKCLKAPVPEGAAIAFLSWSYNVGTGAACRSTLVRKANAGDLFGACDELRRWTRAGGQVVPGLVNRRKAEHALCIRALEAVGLRRGAPA